MRRIGRVDANQATIVAALRAVGCTVYVASGCGQGFPDLVVGYKGLTLLLEVKTLEGKLTPDQKTFFAAWRGSSIAVVRSVPDALAAIGLGAA